VVGLYLNPPDKAPVLSVDKKSPIQAPERTQPGLPLKEGRCGTRPDGLREQWPHQLSAAPNVLDGPVVGECYCRHRHQQFLKSLRRLDPGFPKGKRLHFILAH
jgi:hypothetical protein